MLSNRLPASLSISRLKTPIGTALLLSDERELLRALDWSDHEDRLHRLLRLYYGDDITLKAGRVPAGLRDTLDGYFAGDLKQLDRIACATAGTEFQRSVWAALRKIPAGKTIATMAMETFWVLGISGIFAVAALLFVVNDLHEGLVDTSHPGYLAAVAVTMLIAPFLAVQVVNRLLPGLSRKLGRGQLLAEPRLLTAMSVAGLIAFSFVVLGAVVELLAAELFQHPEINLLEMVLLFAVSWTAGFLVPGSPGGIGVREAVMIQLMGPAIGLETALGVALVMRLCSMGADALAFGVGLLFRPKPQPPADDGL